MDHSKNSPKIDKHKTNTSESSKAGKHGEKKDENILTRTAHKIEDKVHQLTDEVKEKAHHLTHSDDSKKGKDHKKPTDKLKLSSKITNKDSDDEDLSKPPAPPSSPAGPPSTGHKSPGAASSEPPSTNPTNETTEPSSVDGSKSSDENPSSAQAASSDSTKNPSAHPSNENADNAKPVDPSADHDSKQTTDELSNTASNSTIPNQTPSNVNPKDKIHILLSGVETVDDVLERVDQAVEKAKIVIDNGQGKSLTDKKEEIDLTSAPATNDKQDKAEMQYSKEEPIRIIYDNIHQLKDLLEQVNDQPGHRKVMIEGVPKQSKVITFKKSNNPSSDETSNEPKDTSTSETTNAGASSEVDQIRLDIQNVYSVDDLLDRLDEAVLDVPVVIDVESPPNDKSASSASNPDVPVVIKTEKQGKMLKKDLVAALKFQKQDPDLEQTTKETSVTF